MPKTQQNIEPSLTVRNGPEAWSQAYPLPQVHDHKYSRGVVVVLGGQRMPGAARLVSRAAQRMGCGMVRIACLESAFPLYAAVLDSIVVEASRDSAGLCDSLIADDVDVAVVGPGLIEDGRSYDYVLAALQANKALVLDASVLRVVARNPDPLYTLVAKRDAMKSCPVVMTPHRGEFDALFPQFADEPDPAKAACLAAEHSGVTVVLKGSTTAIATPAMSGGGTVTDPNGRGNSTALRVLVSSDAPATLASAGTGDVLSGCIAALLALGLDAVTASGMAVWVHSRAAGPIGTVAEDVIGSLPSILATLTQPQSPSSSEPWG